MPLRNITSMHKFGRSLHSIVSQIPDGVRKNPSRSIHIKTFGMFSLGSRFSQEVLRTIVSFCSRRNGKRQ